jgi:hypothetical protein
MKAVPAFHRKLPLFVRVLLNPLMKKRGDTGDRKE